MVDMRKLKARMVESGTGMPRLAEATSRSRSSLYRVLQHPEKLTVRDVRAIAATLRLSADDVQAIFFAPDVA